MSKASRTQGFGSQGGKSFIPQHTTGGGYSAAELQGLAKVGATELGIPFDDPAHVRLCDICGTPIAGSAKSNASRYIEELSKGIHFSCFMQKEELRLRLAHEAFDRLSPAQQEEVEAQRFNTTGASDPRDPKVLGTNDGSPIYRPKPGELSFDRVSSTGVSKVMVDEPIIDLDAPLTPQEQAEADKFEAHAKEDLERVRQAGLLHDRK